MFIEKNQLICPVSKSEKFEELFRIKSFPIYMGVVDKDHKSEFEDLVFNICIETGTVQVFPRIPLEKLYFKSHGSGKIGKIWSDHHKEFHSIIEKYLIGTVVEIGGGHNSIHSLPLNFNNNFKVYSFDPNGKLTNDDNLKVVNKFFSEDAMNAEGIDIVDLFIHSHLLEHIYEPLDFLNLINKYLKNDGMHIFSLPNMKKMIDKGFANAMNFEHPFYLEETLVDHLLRISGFRTVKKLYFKSEHSIMYITQKCEKQKFNLDNNYSKNKTFFNNLISNWRKDVGKINDIIKNYNGEIFLFGAHIFSQNLIFLGLNESKIKSILDNDPDKQGDYLYGTKIIVQSPMVLERIENPLVILRTGAYNDEIKENILKINPNCQFI